MSTANDVRVKVYGTGIFLKTLTDEGWSCPVKIVVTFLHDAWDTNNDMEAIEDMLRETMLTNGVYYPLEIPYIVEDWDWEYAKHFNVSESRDMQISDALKELFESPDAFDGMTQLNAEYGFTITPLSYEGLDV